MKYLFRRRRKVAFVATLLFTCGGNASEQIAKQARKQDELNEGFMRSLNKDQCMAKTVASLRSGDQSIECLKSLAGITGDCQTWAKCDPEEFCEVYRQKYLASNC